MSKYLRDPLHGEIRVPEEFLPIVDNPRFQRLRRVRQLGVSSLIYPGATHTRFLHSIGTFHISRSIHKPLMSLYALVHDVGHPPFSHVVESAIQKAGRKFDHEKNLFSHARSLLAGTVFSTKDLRRAVEQGEWVHGDLGVDRLDYIPRDSYFTGVKIGYFDWKRLLRLTRVRRGKTIINPKAVDIAEHFFVARFILGSSVYMHKTNLIAEAMVSKAISILLEEHPVREVVNTDDDGLAAMLVGNERAARFWSMVQERKLFKMVGRFDDEGRAREAYELLEGKLGWDSVVEGERGRWHRDVNIWLDTGENLLDSSPLINSLVDADRKKQYYFVAVEPRRKRMAERILRRLKA